MFAFSSGGLSESATTELPGSPANTARNFVLHQQLATAGAAFDLRFQVAFDPTGHAFLRVSKTPWWESEATHPRTYGLLLSADGLESMELALTGTNLVRVGVPYLAGWASGTLLCEDLGPGSVPRPADPFQRTTYTRATAEEAVQMTRQMQAIEIIAGWWLAQQPDTTAADCELIAAWRAPADSIVSPAIPLRIGYGLGDHTYAELRAILGLDVH